MSDAAVIRVLLAEDQALVRGAMAALLDLEGDIEVVAQAGRGDEVVELSARTRPHVALLDIEMPGMTGLEVAAQLTAEQPEVRALIVTTFGRPGFLRRAMEAGAGGFVLKDAPVEQLSDAIRRVAAGERVVDSDLAAAALSEGASPLTAREEEILGASREHATIAELAAAVHLSAGTTRNHLSAAMQKLGAPTRVAAVRVAEEKGWL